YFHVTGVQTCALPIFPKPFFSASSATWDRGAILKSSLSQVESSGANRPLLKTITSASIPGICSSSTRSLLSSAGAASAKLEIVLSSFLEMGVYLYSSAFWAGSPCSASSDCARLFKEANEVGVKPLDIASKKASLGDFFVIIVIL